MCLSTGCSSYWYQEEKSFSSCQQDLKQCYEEMQKYADMDSVCTYEVGFVKDCMKEKGYKLVCEHQLPKYAKREDPSVDKYWLLAGVAGTLE
jgi:hypothetical protein